MSERVVRRRLVGRTVRWGFDVGEYFYLFVDEASAREAANTVGGMSLESYGRLAQSMCPLVEGDAG